MSPVWRHSDAVEPGSADDADAPAALAAGAKDCEGVIVDDRVGGPAATTRLAVSVFYLDREVDPGEE
jgi:hypothetical protein